MSEGEKRHCPRYAIEASVELLGHGEVIRGRCRNVSEGGLCAIVDRSAPTGAPLTVRIALVFSQDSFSEPLELPARAVWSTAFATGYQLGLQFLALSDEQRSFLDMFLRFLEENAGARDPGDADPEPFHS